MRFLYGDSSPFPAGHNFLKTVESFLANAPRVVLLEDEVRQLEASTARAAKARSDAFEALFAFDRMIVRALQDAAGHNAEPQTKPYAAQMTAHAARLIEEAKRTLDRTNEQDDATLRAETTQRRREQRAALEAFLLRGPLPTESARVSMTLVEGRNEMSAVFANPEGIRTVYQLASSQSPAWQAPRRVSDFVPSLDVRVGVKKGWLSRSVQPEVVHLGDWLLTGFDLAEREANVRVRRRDVREGELSFVLTRLENGSVAAAVHVTDAEAEGELPPLDEDERDQLVRLWQALAAAVLDPLGRRERLLALEIEGADVFEGGHFVPFVARVVKLTAPVIAEIARRSPNPSELSLKSEDENGRREELYVRKADLSAALKPLGTEQRRVFAPLGLEAAPPGPPPAPPGPPPAPPTPAQPPPAPPENAG